MGVSFTHVHVHVGEAPADVALARVVAALRRDLAADGWVEVAEPTVGARQVWIAPADDGPWLTVYDSRCELQDDAVVTLATRLSSALPGDAFAVRVHDGDLLEVFRAREGALQQQWSSWPGYFDGARPPAAAQGASSSHDALAALAEIAAEHGWSTERAVGASTLPPSLRARCVGLAFGPGAPAGEDRSPPAFDHVGGVVQPREVPSGGTFTVTVVAHNVGGPMRGFSVVVFGPAVATGAVRPDAIVARLGDPATPVVVVAPLVRGAGDEPSWVATLADVVLPRGHADAAAAFRAAADAEGAIAGWTAARVELELTATAVAEGRARLHVGLVPRENPDAGQVAFSTAIRARGGSAPRRGW